jgi:hypothetical protein
MGVKKIIVILLVVMLILVLLQLYSAIVNERSRNIGLPYYDGMQDESSERRMLLIINT